jgi:hypothetical protein
MRSTNTSWQKMGCAFKLFCDTGSQPVNTAECRTVDTIASTIRRKPSSHPLAPLARTNPVRIHDPDVTCASRIKIPTPNPTSFHSAILNRALPPGRIVSLKQVSHETGIVFSTAASSTPLLVSGQGLATARDDIIQDSARTAHALALSVNAHINVMDLTMPRQLARARPRHRLHISILRIHAQPPSLYCTSPWKDVSCGYGYVLFTMAERLWLSVVLR